MQPLSLDPVHDSVDKLARVWNFCHEIEDAGLPVIVGRVGAFGLVLQALGISAFEGGLGAAERYSWTDQVRPPKPKSDDDKATRGGAGKRIYLEPLLTTCRPQSRKHSCGWRVSAADSCATCPAAG